MFNHFVSENRPVYKIMWEKIRYSQTGHRRQYYTAQKKRDVRAAGQLRQEYRHTLKIHNT